MISNEGKKKGRWHYLTTKKLSTLLRGIISKHHGDFIVLIVFILLEQKINLSLMKKYVKIKISAEL